MSWRVLLYFHELICFITGLNFSKSFPPDLSVVFPGLHDAVCLLMFSKEKKPTTITEQHLRCVNHTKVESIDCASSE